MKELQREDSSSFIYSAHPRSPCTFSLPLSHQLQTGHSHYPIHVAVAPRRPRNAMELDRIEGIVWLLAEGKSPNTKIDSSSCSRRRLGYVRGAVRRVQSLLQTLPTRFMV